MTTHEDPSLTRSLRGDWPLYALLLVVAVLTAAVYGELPAELPIHWDWQGEADRWASRPVAVLLLPCTAVLVHLFVTGALAIDPRLSDDEEDRRALSLFRTVPSAFLLCLHVILLAVWLGKPIDVTGAVFAATGVLVAILGNVLGRVRPNYFVGIRLPWTLERDDVWKKTHRFAGRLWFLGGCAMVFSPFVGGALQLVYFLGIWLVLVVAPVVFAYRTYERCA